MVLERKNTWGHNTSTAQTFPLYLHTGTYRGLDRSLEGEWRKSSLAVAAGVQVELFIQSLQNSDALQQHAEISLGLMKAMKPALSFQIDFHGDTYPVIVFGLFYSIKV